MSVQARRSCPIRVEQVIRSAAEKAASKARADAKKPKAPCAQRRPGRPKGRKNTPKADGTFTPEFLRITGWLDALLHLIAGVVSLTYVVLDGHFGNHNALQMARQHNLHLISKLRYDAALYFPFTGPYAGRGPHRKYGARSITTTSPCNTSKRPRSRGTLRPVSIRCHCSIRGSRNR